MRVRRVRARWMHALEHGFKGAATDPDPRRLVDELDGIVPCPELAARRVNLVERRVRQLLCDTARARVEHDDHRTDRHDADRQRAREKACAAPTWRLVRR